MMPIRARTRLLRHPRPSLLLGWALLLLLLLCFICFVVSKPTRSVKNKRQLNRRYYEIRSNCENNPPVEPPEDGDPDATARAAAASAPASASGQQPYGGGGGGCAHLLFEESTSCVTECISPACHARVYGEDPLELGEVDRVRYAEFELCAKREVKELARLERIQKRKSAAAAYKEAPSTR